MFFSNESLSLLCPEPTFVALILLRRVFEASGRLPQKVTENDLANIDAWLPSRFDQQCAGFLPLSHNWF